MLTELLVPFERMLDDVSPSQMLRRAEAGDDVAAMWAEIRESGFLDALVPEAGGGAGLPFELVGSLVQAMGRRLLPVPFAQTIAARALLAAADLESPEGPIILLTPIVLKDGRGALAVPCGLTARHALVDLGIGMTLADLSAAKVSSNGIHASESADIVWTTVPVGPALPLPPNGLRPIAAVLRAAEIAGACDSLLTATIDYANQRTQFGKPIARQQAIQQQLSVMAEQCVMARMAAQIGFAHGFTPPLAAAAVAKQVAGAAAAQVAAIAHAVYGAIGFSEELDLQLYTRRLYEWRIADGSDSYWAEILGNQRLAGSAENSIDHVRLMMA